MAGTLTKRWPNRFIFRHHHRKSQQKTHSNELNTPCGRILVKTATLQNGHTQNGHKTFCYQNGHNQNGHRGRITTKTATLHLVKTATEGGSLPKRPHCIRSKATEVRSLPKRPHYSKMATETETLHMIPERGRITTKTATQLQNGHRDT